MSKETFTEEIERERIYTPKIIESNKNFFDLHKNPLLNSEEDVVDEDSVRGMNIGGEYPFRE